MCRISPTPSPTRPSPRSAVWLIQIASGEAGNPFPTMPDYAASKAALVNATVSLAKALDGSGVTANTVSRVDGGSTAAIN